MREKQVYKLLASITEHAKGFWEFTSQEAQWVVFNPLIAIDIFVSAIRARIKKNFSIWKTIGGNIEKGKISHPDFDGSFEKSKCVITREAEILFARVEQYFWGEGTSYDLTITTPFELGFFKGATKEEIDDRAKILGLNYCTGDMMKRLRVAYQDQPVEECLFVAMKSINIDGRDSMIFSLKNEKGSLILTGVSTVQKTFWESDDKLIFVVPRVLNK